MTRVVPSVVCEAIDKLNLSASAGWNHLLNAIALLPVIDAIPAELLVLDAVDMVSFLAAVEGARVLWQKHLANQATPPADQYLQIPGQAGRDPIQVIRELLRKCPDAAPSPASLELGFITDVQFRLSLRIDMAAAHRSLASGDWKACTIIAGSLCEALLLWALQQNPAQSITAASNTLRQMGTIGKLSNDPNEWSLHPLLEVSTHMNLVTPDTAKQVSLAKEFRNLIHPGRAARLAAKCDRGTALAALAAVDLVVRDLS